MGRISGLPFCEAMSFAAWIASCDFTVNLSQRIAIVSSRLSSQVRPLYRQMFVHFLSVWFFLLTSVLIHVHSCRFAANWFFCRKEKREIDHLPFSIVDNLKRKAAIISF